MRGSGNGFDLAGAFLDCVLYKPCLRQAGSRQLRNGYKIKNPLKMNGYIFKL